MEALVLLGETGALLVDLEGRVAGIVKCFRLLFKYRKKSLTIHDIKPAGSLGYTFPG